MKNSNYFSWVVCLVISLLLGCAGAQKAPQEQRYEKVFEVDLPKHKIYEESLQWMAERFVSSKAVLEYKNEEEGTIIGNGSVEIRPVGYVGYLGYTLKIEIKDKKYRVTAYGFRKADSTNIHPYHYQKPKAIAYALGRIDLLANDLHAYLNQEKKSADW